MDLKKEYIETVPEPVSERRAIRRLAADFIARRVGDDAPDRMELACIASGILEACGLPPSYTGFAMIAADNAFWRESFGAVPFNRRALFLPHCLRDSVACEGEYSPEALHCAGCGRCNIKAIVDRAEELGYRVVVAEGTPGVMKMISSQGIDAIFGVACMDTLDVAFERVSRLGVPHLSLPLLRDGCKDTEVEMEELLSMLELHSESGAFSGRSYLPLIRFTAINFQSRRLENILDGYLDVKSFRSHINDPLKRTDSLAFDYLSASGKRLRPFITLSAYAALCHGDGVLHMDTDLESLFPTSVLRVAVAIESLHKASLVHDDIEDNDVERDGRPALHTEYGMPVAINVGDFLVGLGYRLIAGQGDSFGAKSVVDILDNLSQSHIRLCRGQGGEFFRNTPESLLSMKPLEVLSLYALKTAPAFESALYAGLRIGGCEIERGMLRNYCKALGVAYQILNDLGEWHAFDGGFDISFLRDVKCMRPTFIHALALEVDQEGRYPELREYYNMGGAASVDFARRLDSVYWETGVYDSAAELVERYRVRASAIAEELEGQSLTVLLKFLAGIILPRVSRKEPS